jgi:hypothetical protein
MQKSLRDSAARLPACRQNYQQSQIPTKSEMQLMSIIAWPFSYFNLHCSQGFVRAKVALT